jgi:hypothetical protein
MIRRTFLVAVLAVMAGIAQSQQAAPNPGMVQGAQATPPTNVYVVSGYYGTGVYVVPSGGMVAPPGTVGISVANQGISMNTPIEGGVESTLGPRPVIYGTPAYGPNYPPPYSSEAAVETSGRPINDMAPSYAGGAAAPAAPPMSLGEVAAQYKTNRSPSARSFTNTDAERLANRITIGGTSVTVNAAPVAPVTPVEAPKTEPPPQSATENQPAATAPPAPQPRPEQPAERQSIDQLPATSTLLPILGLAGILSGGIGLLVRKKSK